MIPELLDHIRSEKSIPSGHNNAPGTPEVGHSLVSLPPLTQLGVAARTHSFVATTMIATVLARICAIAPNSATLLVGFDMSLSGTVTSEPGPGLGSPRKNKNLCRVSTSPPAYRTLVRPWSAVYANPPAASI